MTHTPASAPKTARPPPELFSTPDPTEPIPQRISVLASLDSKPANRKQQAPSRKLPLLKLSSFLLIAGILAWFVLGHTKDGTHPRTTEARLSHRIEPEHTASTPSAVLNESASASQAASIERIASIRSSDPEPAVPASGPPVTPGLTITGTDRPKNLPAVGADTNNTPPRKSPLATLAAPTANKSSTKPKRSTTAPITRRHSTQQESFDSDVILLEALVSENRKHKKASVPANEVQP